MPKKYLKEDYDVAKHHDRLEMMEVFGASIGALSFGAAGVVAFTELLPDQSEQYLAAGALTAIAIGGLALATNAGVKLPILKSMLQADAQPKIQATPNQSD